MAEFLARTVTEVQTPCFSAKKSPHVWVCYSRIAYMVAITVGSLSIGESSPFYSRGGGGSIIKFNITIESNMQSKNCRVSLLFVLCYSLVCLFLSFFAPDFFSVCDIAIQYNTVIITYGFLGS